VKIYRHIALAFFAILLLWSQGASIAHASNFGDLPHEHDGVACDVTLLGDEQDISLPPPETSDEPLAEFVERTSDTPYQSQVRLTPPARGPPPRAPPLSLC